MATFRVVRKTTAADAAKLAPPLARNPDPLSSDGGRNEPDELCSRTAVTQLKLFDAASAALASSGKAHLALGFCLDEAGSATFTAPPTHAFVSLFASDFRSVRAGLRNVPRAKSVRPSRQTYRLHHQVFACPPVNGTDEVLPIHHTCRL